MFLSSWSGFWWYKLLARWGKQIATECVHVMLCAHSHGSASLWTFERVCGSEKRGARKRESWSWNGEKESTTRFGKQKQGQSYVNMQTDEDDFQPPSDLVKTTGTFCVLVGVTGSVAALKLPVLVSELLHFPGVSLFFFNELSSLSTDWV